MGVPALRTALAAVADLVWPRLCAGCGRPADRSGRHLCSACFADLPWHTASGCCRICGALAADETAHDFVCGTCRDKPPAFARACSAVRYAAPASEMLMAFKYRHATWFRSDLVDFLEGAVRAKLAWEEIDVVVPVPLHPFHLRERGYNQAALLAGDLARRIDRRYDGTSCCRIRDTPRQARLTGEDRRKNLVGAFMARGPYLRGRTVLLIDDVMTTGSTLSCASEAILAAGARRVWCATVARAV